jgi:hypothetical protein
MVGRSRLVAAMLVGVLATLFAGCGGSARSTGPGADGSGGTPSNVYVDMIRQTAVDKIDLVFMIDNSISMADKQLILAEAVPVLVSQLIDPPLVDGRPKFEPVRDIHVAVITSSLGAHGGQICTDATGNDHGRALGAVRAGLASWDNTGFLAWDPLGTKNTPPGTASPEVFLADFAAMVQAAGENGCAFEASLEAWYRFLIDPEPVRDVALVDSVLTPVDDSGLPCPECIDMFVLSQRQRFLRPDSLLAIVMLSDENDCSIRDEGLGWLVGMTQTGGRPFTMARATSACATNPNDICCRPCNASEPDGPPPGCSTTGTDAECLINGGVLDNSASANEDQLNLRCHETKRRFGLDLLYPTSRYVEGLTAPEVPSRSGGLVRNPLFAPSGDLPGRDPNLVFLAGIVGVPWQDIADEASLTGAGLRFLTADEMLYADPANRWDVILGDPENNVPPADPFMIESPAERSGQNPITGASITPSSGDTANPINGKEQTNIDSTDLQYACTFPLSTPRPCVTPECDCGPGTEARNRSLCSQSGAGLVGNTQYHAKAYPGLRQLQVLKDFGMNAIVASICPKNPSSPDPVNDPGYGYNPAILGLVERLGNNVDRRCLPRELTAVDDPATPEVDPRVTCTIVEAVPSADGCTCDGSRNRRTPKPTFVDAAHEALLDYGLCGTESLTPCESFCVCEIAQLEGAELAVCQEELSVPGNVYGYCYVDADQGIGNPEIVSYCPLSGRRILRFVGDDTPTKGAAAFIGCIGAPLVER